MTSKIRSLAIGLTCVLSSAVSAQSIARIGIVVPTTSPDTSTHVDLVTGMRTTLGLAAYDSVGRRLPTVARIRWSSGNTAVASVSSSGVVVARKRGYATITATMGTMRATTRACVTAVPSEQLTTAIQSLAIVPARLRMAPRTTTDTLHARIQYRVTGATAWGSCVHWALDSIVGLGRASIDRSGVLLAPSTVRVVFARATIGTLYPWR